MKRRLSLALRTKTTAPTTIPTTTATTTQAIASTVTDGPPELPGAAPKSQGAHNDPPQSTSSSSPFLTWSTQDARAPGRKVHVVPERR